MSGNKAHLSAPTDLNPRMGAEHLPWRIGMMQGKHPVPSRHPVLFPWGIMGKAGRASEPKLSAGIGGREGARPLTPRHAGPQDTPPIPPPALTPTTQNSRCPPFTLTGVGSLLAGLVFCWFMLFSFFKQQLSYFF